MKKRILYFVFLGLMVLRIHAQEDSAKAKIEFNGYLETYFGLDFALPASHERPCFMVNHNRSGEFNLNLGLVQASVKHSDYRANLGLMVGTYPQANLSSEPNLLRNVYEASVGVRIDKKAKLWADVGIFPSHLGTESPIGADNATLSRALAAEGSPYYLSGAKLTWKPNEKMSLTGLIVNGWQRIWMVPGNSLPAFGHQFQYKSTKGLLLNWSSFIGSEDNDAYRRMRYFNNFYVQWKPEGRFSVLAGFDIGFQQRGKGLPEYDVWMAPQIVLSYQIAKRWTLASRFEYFYDPSGVAVSCNRFAYGMNVYGLSVNADLKLNEHILWRMEGRLFQSPDLIFLTKTGYVNQNGNVLTSLCFRI